MAKRTKKGWKRAWSMIEPCWILHELWRAGANAGHCGHLGQRAAHLVMVGRDKEPDRLRSPRVVKNTPALGVTHTLRNVMCNDKYELPPETNSFETCRHECSCVNGKCNAVDGTCDCDSGWEGEQCQTDIDGCANDPCFDAVPCTDLKAPQTGFECGECPDGFLGDGIICEENI
ncbi:hypothetical protein CAPTEDRAFT_228585 [Capitella teleta]|uniref:EGF-like domain-containing protein n=1 Tax=Capitella teleta TaxID=283909 RepID=R7VHE7_CAPTE|nr:hypothetical protein CAPTEDRAFT_228585 [Capitella teleta]|eukprot:ELU15120.1 hypothetical protein CAPTEDRAFT_228585 [Capitella teleta]